MLNGNETVTILLSEYERLRQFEKDFDNKEFVACMDYGSGAIKLLKESETIQMLYRDYKAAQSNHETWYRRARAAGYTSEKHGT